MIIAVLITSYNRVQTTIRCLKHFAECIKPAGYGFDIYHVDDNSPDRTGEMIAEQFPEVRQVKGSGSLYWCGGMRLAWETAVRTKDYDAFLWLNDDTFLYPDALQIFTNASEAMVRQTGDAGIIVGATCDPATQRTTYGFTGTPPRSPDGTVSPMRNSETMNGNVVWVSRKTWQCLGGFRACFTHAMGDTDYGVRAVKSGVSVVLAPTHVGTCKGNAGKRWDDPSLSFWARWRTLHSAKGCPPWEFMQLVRIAHPRSWPKYVLKLYWRLLFPRDLPNV